MKTIIALIICSCLSLPARATVLGDVAAGMAPGSWTLLNTNNFSYELLEDAGNYNIFEYCDNATWDAKTEQVLFLSSGHTVPGKHGAFIRYQANDNTWYEHSIPSLMAEPRHGYDHNAIDPVKGIFYHRVRGTNQFIKYDTQTKQWSNIARNNITGDGACCNAIAYFPEMKGLVYLDANANGLYLWNEANNSWSTLKTGLSLGSYQGYAEYNPVHKVVIAGGGNGSNTVYKLDASGTVTKMNNAPIGVGIMQTVITVDPVSGDYLVLDVNKNFWIYDVTTDTWTKQPGMAPIFVFGEPVFATVATPVSTYGVTMFLKCSPYDPVQRNVVLYKHSASSRIELAENPAGRAGIDVCPNPFNTMTSITVKGIFPALSVYDLNGRLVSRLPVHGQKAVTWDASACPAGVYLLKANIHGKQLTRKLLLQK
jgi:hypothetical protein